MMFFKVLKVGSNVIEAAVNIKNKDVKIGVKLLHQTTFVLTSLRILLLGRDVPLFSVSS